MKKNIAILTGGYDSERVISLKSSKVVKNNIDTSLYNLYQIDITKQSWWCIEEGVEVDKNDFSIILKGSKVKFNAVFMCIHGSPVEDGMIQGYFEMLDIPYTGCNGLTSAITMDKAMSKDMVALNTNIKTANYIKLHKSDSYKTSEIIEKLGLPMFIKPNSAGSSFGVSKVKSEDNIMVSIDLAFEYDDTIIIEEFIEGQEFSNGVYHIQDEYYKLPVTEIISENEFFDYEAKYLEKSKEITPAQIDEKITNDIQNASVNLFKLFGCKQFSRFDYLVRSGEVYFIEANTLPGLSEQSIYPQQIKCYGLTLSEVFNRFLNEIL